MPDTDIKCLLFIASDRLLGQRTLRSSKATGLVGFALLPRSFKNERPDVCDLFQRNNLPAVNSPEELASLGFAWQSERFDMVEMMIDGASTSLNPFNIYAVNSMNKELVRLLFSRTGNVLFLRYCCSSRKEFKWKYRCQYGIHSGRDFLDKDNLRIIKWLLRTGVDLKYRHPLGGTLLHLAAKRGYDSIRKFIRRYRLDVNAIRIDGRTPFHVAVEYQNGPFNYVLLKNGADIERKDQDGMTVLHLAASLRYGTTVLCLLYDGADPNITNNQGATPIFAAARKGHIEMMKYLLQFGARVDIKDEDGRTVFHEALTGRRLRTFRFLLEYSPTNFGKLMDTDIGTLLQTTILPNRSFFDKVCNVLSLYTVKVIVLDGTYRCNTPAPLVSWLDGFADFRQECLNEISSLRNEVIGRTNICLLDFMTKTRSQLVSVLRNASVARRVRSVDLGRFPIYGNMIKYHFNQAIQRKKALREGVNMCQFLIRQFSALPLEIKVKILDDFSDRDLHVLVGQAWREKIPI